MGRAITERLFRRHWHYLCIGVGLLWLTFSVALLNLSVGPLFGSKETVDAVRMLYVAVAAWGVWGWAMGFRLGRAMRPTAPASFKRAVHATLLWAFIPLAVTVAVAVKDAATHPDLREAVWLVSCTLAFFHASNLPVWVLVIRALVMGGNRPPS